MALYILCKHVKYVHGISRLEHIMHAYNFPLNIHNESVFRHLNGFFHIVNTQTITIRRENEIRYASVKVILKVKFWLEHLLVKYILMYFIHGRVLPT